MRYLIAVAVVWFAGCTAKVPDYVSATDGESTRWVRTFDDSTENIGIYVHYENGKISACMTCYASPDSIDFIKDLNISINDYSKQDVLMSFTYGEFPGTTKKYSEAAFYPAVRDSIIADCRAMSGEQVSFLASRTYSVTETELPETLEVWYSVTTAGGHRAGRAEFKKIEREHEEVMRFH
jgi:hypothetical protein